MDKIILKSESDLSDRLPTNIDKKNRSFVILRSDDPLNPSPCSVSDDSGKFFFNLSGYMYRVIHKFSYT